MSQPMPQQGRHDVFVWLHELLRQREAKGEAEYGGPLMTHNGRDPLWDALEEALDLCAYLAQAVMERGSHDHRARPGI